MKTSTEIQASNRSTRRRFKPTNSGGSHEDERARQLSDIAASGNEDAAECAAADLFREFPPLP